MAFKVAAFFHQDPDKYLLMPLAKLLLHAEGMRVLNGEVLIERKMSKEDVEMMKFMKDHEQEFFAEIQEIIREADTDSLNGLFGGK